MRVPAFVGVVFASLHAVGISVLSTGAELRDYWPVPFTLVIVTALTGIGLQLPIMWHDTMAHYVDYQRMRLQAAQYAHARASLGSPPVVEPATIRVIEPELSAHDRAWRHFLIRCAAESERVGSVSYQRMKDFFGQDRDKWRAYVDLLVKWDKCWPIQARVETFLKPGCTPTLICDLLVGGQLPPTLPPHDPPSLDTRQQGEPSTGGNSGETGDYSASTGSTQFASTHEGNRP